MSFPRSFAVSCLFVASVGCSAAEDDLGETSEDALTAPTAFVLSAASTPACAVGSANSTPMDVTGCANAPTFKLHKASKTLRLASDPTACLDVQYADKTVGAAVMLHPCHGGSNQSWRVSTALERSHLTPAVRIEAFAKDGPSNLCLGNVDGKLKLETCAAQDGRGWVLDKRVGDRLAQRGRVVTSLLTLGMIEPQDSTQGGASRSESLPPSAGELAVDLVTRALPPLGRRESPRILVVLDDAHHGENAEDAANTTAALQRLLTKTHARLEVQIRAGVEVTVTTIQAIIEDEISRLEVDIIERRSVVRLLVATTLVVVTTKATVELVNEPAAGLTHDDLRMSDSRRPHAVWFSNPGHVIDDRSTLDALLRFAQRGGGVVIQGDDAAQGTQALTGLELRGPWQEANGHVYCGRAFDNGSAKYPLQSTELPLAGLVYTDDLDLVTVVDPRVQILATAAPVCNGTTEKVPAVVMIDAD